MFKAILMALGFWRKAKLDFGSSADVTIQARNVTVGVPLREVVDELGRVQPYTRSSPIVRG